MNIDWMKKTSRDFTPEYKKKILNKHKDMSYETAKYRYEFAKNQHYSVPQTKKEYDEVRGEYFTWTDEEFDKVMFWEYVENYYEILLYAKQREHELKNPLHKEFVNKNIIITDPCYIFEDTYKAEVEGILMRDTIYGDWSCTTYNSETKTEIGKFCADAGMVCVVETDNEMVDHEKLMKLPSFCRTIIENFTGTVYIKRIQTESDFGDEIQVIGEGNINFIGKQTVL